MRILITVVAAVAVALLLTLPGYCSDWWPVWLQATSLTAGVTLLAGIVALLAWMLGSGESTWRV